MPYVGVAPQKNGGLIKCSQLTCLMAKWHKMYRVVVKVLWCLAHLVWLVFKVPTRTCFHSVNFSVTLVLLVIKLSLIYAKKFDCVLN